MPHLGAWITSGWLAAVALLQILGCATLVMGGVSRECSGCNIVAYTIYNRLEKERDLALQTNDTILDAMKSTCSKSGCGVKAGRVSRMIFPFL